jgi:hypothetical protein
MAERNSNLQWCATPAPKQRRHDDIWFSDPQIGWAVNSDGQIIKTIDGGVSWIPQLQDDVYWRCIGFATPQGGWAGTLTRGRRLYATTDGGATWELIDARLPANAPPGICGLSVVNEQVVYASGTNFPNRPAAVVKTTDGGATWSGLDVTWTDDLGMAARPSLLVDIYFTTPERGWVSAARRPSSPTPSTHACSEAGALLAPRGHQQQELALLPRRTLRPGAGDHRAGWRPDETGLGAPTHGAPVRDGGTEPP